MKKYKTQSALQAIKVLSEDARRSHAASVSDLMYDGSSANAIIKLRKQCRSIKYIAKQLHKSDRYVAWVLRRHPEAIDKNLDMLNVPRVLRLHRKGMSFRAIAKYLYISARTVARVVHNSCAAAHC